MLRAAQFKAALAGNTTLLIWLGRVVLNQVPGASININIGQSGELEPSDEMREYLFNLASAIYKTAKEASSGDMEALAEAQSQSERESELTEVN